mgnify:CR=1 FL=1
MDKVGKLYAMSEMDEMLIARASRGDSLALEQVLSEVRAQGSEAARDARHRILVLDDLRRVLSRESAPMSRVTRRALGLLHVATARAHTKLGERAAAVRAIGRAYATWPPLALKHAAKLARRALNGSTASGL